MVGRPIVPLLKIMIMDRQNIPTQEKEGALAHKVAVGVFWIAASYTLSNTFYFLRTIILVRLLNPIDFGIMGIARVVLNMFSIFSETGIGTAIVQKKDVDETVLNTAWLISVVRGVILFTLLFVFSPTVSIFYNNVQLKPILRLISLSFLFTGLASAGVFLFVKELNFKNKVIYEQVNSISNTVISISLAFILRNAWALVIGHVVGAIVGLIFSYKLHPFRPSLKFDIDALRGLFRFGKYVFGSGIVIFIVIQGPDALVGKILGLNALGYYVLAFSIANIPTTSVTHVVSQIAFPAYAALQDDLPKLREGYFKVIRLVAFLSTAIAGAIFMLTPEFVQIFLGSKWIAIIIPVRILCVLGFFRSIASTASPVFYGIGRPDLEFKFACFNFVLLGILIYPFTVKMGIIGTSIAFSTVSTITVFFMMTIIYKLIHLHVEKTQFFKVLFFPLIGTLLMCFLIYVLKLFLSSNLVILFWISIIMGSSFYILALYVLDRYFGYGLIDTIRFAANSFRRNS